MRRSLAIPILALAILAGCGGGGLPAVEGPTRAVLELEATEMRFDPKTIAVAAGRIPVVLCNVGIVVHAFGSVRRPGWPSPPSAASSTWSRWPLRPDPNSTSPRDEGRPSHARSR